MRRVPDTSSNGHFLNQTLPQSDTSPIEELSILRKCPFEEVSDSIFSLYSMWKKRYKLFFNQVPSPWDISLGQRQFVILVVFWSYTFLNDRLRKTFRKRSYIGKILLKNFEICKSFLTKCLKFPALFPKKVLLNIAGNSTKYCNIKFC